MLLCLIGGHFFAPGLIVPSPTALKLKQQFIVGVHSFLCFLHPLAFICSRAGRLLLIRSKSSCLEGECAWNSALCILSVREPLGLFSSSQKPNSRACASVYSTSPHLWVCCFDLLFQFRLVLHPIWKRNHETNPCTSEPSWAGAARF